uniref:DUF7027 domain-containing protein n=1 Tax=Caenorhabditis japonica TaxID=281687 RepID=A0A8R1HVF5_CAEJA
MIFLSSFELAFCLITGSVTMYNIMNQNQEISVFEVCLVGLMLFFACTSIFMLIGIRRHACHLLYPSLFARGLTTLFLAVFGVSTVFSSSKSPNAVPYSHQNWKRGGKDVSDEPNMALRLVLFVFAMLFLTVIIFYTSYLVVRLIHFEQSYARLKERRSSLIQAGMIDPDFPSPNNYSASRRASSA